MTASLAITGIGLVGPFGLGRDALRGVLESGELVRSEVDRSRGFHLPDAAATAGLVDRSSYRAWVDNRTARRMSLPSQLAVAAARLAFADAEVERESVSGRGAAVVLGTAFGPTDTSTRILDQIRGQGPESVSPFLFMESVANVHAGQIALDNELVGPNATVTQREAGTLLAVVQAAAYVHAGAAPFALAGGVEEIAPLTHAVLDRFRALSRTRADERGRAFDRDRDGTFLSEGAVVVLLEPLESAREQGRTVHAVLRASVRATDPTATAQNWGGGDEALAGALRAGLVRNGIDPGSIDRVVSGANGSVAGDRLEAGVLKRLFGAELPPVLAPKASTGEYGAGLLGAAVLAVGDEGRWPTPGFEAIDPACGVRPHDGRTLAPARRVLVSALAAGGPAAWLVLDAPDEVA